MTPHPSDIDPTVQPCEPSVARVSSRCDAESMWLTRPTSECIVVHITGDLDTPRTSHLEQLLAPRLTSTVRTLVLDLSEVSFLGVEGLVMLARAHHQAASRGIVLRVLTGPPAVDRALRAGGLTHLAAADGLTHASQANCEEPEPV